MPSTVILQCLGGVGTVTGSKYLLAAGGRRVLLDCGLFQGLKALRLRNWEAPAFDPRSLDAVVLSHAHIDHCGYLPLVVRHGFHGPVYCTPATASLLQIVLPDAAHLQEEDAAFANRHRFSKHDPALPLYTREDAEQALKLLQPQMYQAQFEAAPGLNVTFRRAGHILGSASIDVEIREESSRRLVYSGDLGRWGRPMLRNPEFVPSADVLLIESTYGDRVHDTADANAGLARIINAAVARRGPVMVPAFAVGRTQELIWRIRELEDTGPIPHLPVFIDSPMATDVTAIFCHHPEDHDIDMQTLMDEQRCPLCCKPYHLTRSVDESKALNQQAGTFILIAGSGMATGGRVVHHLRQRLSDDKTTVLLVGFQAAGTRGRSLQDGTKTLRMHGQDIPVHAHIEVLHGLSAHSDRNELLQWISGFEQTPQRIYVVHGEPSAAEALAASIRERWRSDVRVAQDRESIRLT